MVAEIRREVRRHLAALAQAAEGSDAAGPTAIVALSGGADSLALAAATAFEAPKLGVRAIAVVVDHGLQAGSMDVAAAARAQAEALGLEARVVRVEVGADGGPEAAARDARYAALAAAADAAEASAILLGHTLDDQAETVLLGLARGSGARSLAGMAPVSGPFRRPFLGLRRAETEGACADQGLPIVVDPTNEPDGPWRRADGGPLRRVAVRHQAIPALEEALGTGVIPALARTADMLRADADHLDAEAEHWFLQHREEVGRNRLRADELAQLGDALRTRVIRRAIMEAVGAGLYGEVSRKHVKAVDSLVTHYRGQGTADLPGGTKAMRVGRDLYLSEGRWTHLTSGPTWQRF